MVSIISLVHVHDIMLRPLLFDVCFIQMHRSAQIEHEVLITDTGVEVLTVLE